MVFANEYLCAIYYTHALFLFIRRHVSSNTYIACLSISQPLFGENLSKIVSG